MICLEVKTTVQDKISWKYWTWFLKDMAAHTPGYICQKLEHFHTIQNCCCGHADTRSTNIIGMLRCALSTTADRQIRADGYDPVIGGRSATETVFSSVFGQTWFASCAVGLQTSILRSHYRCTGQLALAARPAERVIYKIAVLTFKVHGCREYCRWEYGKAATWLTAGKRRGHARWERLELCAAGMAAGIEGRIVSTADEEGRSWIFVIT